MIHVVPIHVFNTVMLVSLAAAVLATPFTSIVICSSSPTPTFALLRHPGCALENWKWSAAMLFLFVHHVWASVAVSDRSILKSSGRDQAENQSAYCS